MRWRTKRVLGLASVALLATGCQLVEGLNPQSQAVKLDRETVERVAVAAQATGGYAAAAGVLQQYAEKNPNDAAAQLSLGEAALTAGELDRALDAFGKARALAPNRVDPRMGLGRVHLAKREPTKAAAEFEAVLSADPKHLRALNGAGIALDMLGRSQDAQKHYRAALVTNPNDQATRNNLGLSLALSGSYDEAVARLQQLALEPGVAARVRHNLSLALGLKGDEAGAARVIKADLDEGAIAENQRYFTAMRRLTQSVPDIEYRAANDR